MMSRAQTLVILGSAVIIVGLFLLAGPTLGEGNGFIIVFPFFFGSISPTIALAVGLAFFIAVFLVMRMTVSRVWNLPPQGDSSRSFVPIMGHCSVCGDPLPQNALFCPHCGSPTQTESKKKSLLE